MCGVFLSKCLYRGAGGIVGAADADEDEGVGAPAQAIRYLLDPRELLGIGPGIHMEPAERPFAFRNALPGTLHKGRVAAYLFCDIVRGDLGAKTAFIETQHGLS